ncbi:hypothetical protein JCM3765_001332 [Sporobolomyces pararoseus]
MNIFRILGDLSHFFAVSFLIFKLHSHTTSIKGISFTTQVLYLVTYCSRYLDEIWYRSSLYNTIGKIFWLGSSIYIVLTTRRKLRQNPDIDLETIGVEHLTGPCAALAMFFNYILRPVEILWTFSIYLEAVAILPQLFLTHKMRKFNNSTSSDDGGRKVDSAMYYILLMFGYRVLYLANWVNRYFAEEYTDSIAMYGGLVQLAFYLSFFCLYFSRSQS